jgi:hypothetical protein
MRRLIGNATLMAAMLFLAACAGAPVSVPVATRADPTPRYIAMLREEARRADGIEFAPDARLRWRYVVALAFNDPEATQRIRALDAEIASRAAVHVEEGNAEMRRGRLQPARLAYLKALALDGNNPEARRQLAEIDRRTQMARQDRANQRARAAQMAGATEAAQ